MPNLALMKNKTEQAVQSKDAGKGCQNRTATRLLVMYCAMLILKNENVIQFWAIHNKQQKVWAVGIITRVAPSRNSGKLNTFIVMIKLKIMLCNANANAMQC